MARRRLRNLVARQPNAIPRLPLVHTTDVYRVVNAMEDGYLDPPPCDLFVGEPLLYLFYGRPSYRVNSKEEATSLQHYLPICLIFRTGTIAPIKRIFPFDSGAYRKDLYRDALHHAMDLEDFLLEEDHGTPGRVIPLFFGAVQAYLDATPHASVSLDRTELEAISYHALISQRLSNSIDNRVSGIELQFEGRLDINGAVEAIVLPDTLAESRDFAVALRKMDIVPLPYSQRDRMRPSEYVTTIFDVCYAYYKKIGLIR
jgi:hypothetical protein